jgi:hypothetical protein
MELIPTNESLNAAHELHYLFAVLNNEINCSILAFQTHTFPAIERLLLSLSNHLKNRGLVFIECAIESSIYHAIDIFNLAFTICFLIRSQLLLSIKTPLKLSHVLT